MLGLSKLRCVAPLSVQVGHSLRDKGRGIAVLLQSLALLNVCLNVGFLRVQLGQQCLQKTHKVCQSSPFSLESHIKIKHINNQN